MGVIIHVSGQGEIDGELTEKKIFPNELILKVSGDVSMIIE